MPDATQSAAAEPEVGIDGLQKSLDDLLSVADATALSKGLPGVSVEHSGRIDDSGKGGGGQAGQGDVGGLDNMMIAKMSEAGVPADVLAGFQAFMAAKQDDDEEEEESAAMGKDKHAYMGDHKKSEDVPDLQKSMDSFREDKDIADGVDVSPFLEAMTARTTDALDALGKSQAAFQGDQQAVNRATALALHQVGSLVKSQHAVIQHLGERLGMIERQPAAARGARTVAAARGMAKSMPNEAGTPEQQLTKSQLLSTLNYMSLQKGMKQINGHDTSGAVCLYEGGGSIDPSLVQAARQFLTDNPNEAAAALKF